MSFSLATYIGTNRDFKIDETGRLVLTLSEDTTVERLQTRLATWLGDWFLNTARGIDYKNKILGQPLSSEISAILRREILSEKNVERITNFSILQNSENPRGFIVVVDIILTGIEQPVRVIA